MTPSTDELTARLQETARALYLRGLRRSDVEEMISLETCLRSPADRKTCRANQRARRRKRRYSSADSRR
jgi:hypothetical protein